MSDSAASRVGEILADKYLLRRRIGVGGMGEVYLAENTLISRVVAIKVLLPQYAAEPHLVSRFLLEARAANIVRHPNVVDVLDIGQDDAGSPFIVQEFLDGQDLDAVLSELRGNLPLATALELLLPVVDAIAFAHTRGVVHRDLKPSNIFLARDGDSVVPKILDFGIAKLSETPDSIRMTGAGSRMGTPAYMAPEVIRLGAASADARADVWGLGVILYEVLAGTLPFDAEPASALFLRICTEEPSPLSDVAPHIPEEVARILHTCLAKAPDNRYPSAVELSDDLRATMEGLRSTVPVDLRIDLGSAVQQAAERASARPAPVAPTEPDILLSGSTLADSLGLPAAPTPLVLVNEPLVTRVASYPTPIQLEESPGSSPSPKAVPAPVVSRRLGMQPLTEPPPSARRPVLLHVLASGLLVAGATLAHWAGAAGLASVARWSPGVLVGGIAAAVALGLAMVVRMPTSGIAMLGAPVTGCGVLGYAVVLGTSALRHGGADGLPDLSGAVAHAALACVGVGAALTSLDRARVAWADQRNGGLAALSLLVAGAAAVLAVLATAASAGLR